ncbi:perlucin-like protein [Mya arenaria]|uniref:perlucin-like protein n=1 Tax=Mya arenaria TaxID=6604 RepID=UPI0022E2384F|nr:perlucin-like protein [Mya arenaria]
MAEGTVFYTCLLVLFCVTTISCNCPETWVTFGGSCYLFAFGQDSDFTEARHYCQLHHDAYLVEVNDAHENNFIVYLLNNFKDHLWWIGLSDETIEGEWKWVNSDARPEFTYWAAGQPDSYHGSNEDCALFHVHANYTWHDVGCDIKCGIICEKEEEEPVVVG